MMEEYIQVFTTTDSEENANEIAKIVLSKKLAGCTQIIGPTLAVTHPYTAPEIIALPIIEGSKE